MKHLFYILIFSPFFLISCAKVQESAGVTRKSIDEFQVIENPPLVIPPDFNLLPPDQLEEKNIEELESELAEEILFGLEDESEIENSNSTSTINRILAEADALEIDSSIRQEIDQDFVNEMQTEEIFSMDWDDDIEILDAIKESERIRKQNFEGKNIDEGEVPTSKVPRQKKKKRFFFF